MSAVGICSKPVLQSANCARHVNTVISKTAMTMYAFIIKLFFLKSIIFQAESDCDLFIIVLRHFTGSIGRLFHSVQELLCLFNTNSTHIFGASLFLEIPGQARNDY